MRVHIRIDSATTEELRKFVLEHRRATAPFTEPITAGHGPTVVVEGPECWGAQSSALPPQEAYHLLGDMLAALTPLVREYDPALEALLDEEEAIERGSCVITAENIATEDDCTTHDHERLT